MCTTDKKTILVVDDEEDWRNVVSAHLTEAGYDVCAAADATEAMYWSEEPSLGLIIVDDNLDGESGFILSTFLRRNRPDVPTMLYTRFEYDQATMLDIMHQGINQCLPKGSMEELLVTVGSYVANHSAGDSSSAKVAV